MNLFGGQDVANDKKFSYEQLKILFLSFAFFFIIGAYSVLRSLKTSVFFSLVGGEYQPTAKFVTIAALVFWVLLYAKLVDYFERYRLVYYILFTYALVAIFFAIVLSHPVLGVANSQSSPFRLLGWGFYLFIDLFSPLILSSFWAFVNSINDPEGAKKNYWVIAAVSRVAGIMTPSLSWLLLEKTSYSSSFSISMLIIFAALFLSLSGISVWLIYKKIPVEYLKGYEEKSVTRENPEEKAEKPGMLEGIKLMLKHPYVFGIFGLVYSYEIISVILDYQMQILMSVASNNEIRAMSSYMLKYTASFQVLGFFFALFGTNKLLKFIGVKKCLLIMPLAIISLMAFLLSFPNLVVIFSIMVIIRGLHYGFNNPVREILYIPTTKNVKFKSKAWIESFGRHISKISGSTFNCFARSADYLTFIRLDSFFSIGIATIWALISFLIGRKYVSVIEKGEIIGAEPFVAAQRGVAFAKNKAAVKGGQVFQKQEKETQL